VRALYQGTTFSRAVEVKAFGLFAPGCFVMPDRGRQGLKPNFLSLFYGPTQSRALIQNQSIHKSEPGIGSLCMTLGPPLPTHGFGIAPIAATTSQQECSTMLMHEDTDR
jgi:hypothetical protein